jgi:hypothetical protein
MSQSRRLVLLDPGLASVVGHHGDVNNLLLPALQQHGWRVELWADVEAAADPQLASQLPGLRPLLREAGYIDSRHWCDLPGSLHQAALLRPQLEAAATGEPVAVWLAHSLLPFQLIALTQLLQRQPPAHVVISLMFAPGEVFHGQPELDLKSQRQAASLNARTALAALALAVARGGHKLLLCSGSLHLIERYTPLCLAAGLQPPTLHPALVLCNGIAAIAPGVVDQASRPQVLLHWGDRKPDKGRELALAVLERLLRGAGLPPALEGVAWVFHAASNQPPPAREAELLLRASRDSRIRVIEGAVPRVAMLQELAHSGLALLPYCPEAYAERSSGVLWLYGATRVAQGLPARVLGYADGWLASEVPALGLHWHTLPPKATAEAAIEAIAQALQAPMGTELLTPYGREVLGSSWGAWLRERLDADRLI